MRRELLQDIRRVVVKLGTGILTDSRKQPDPVAVVKAMQGEIAAAL